MARPSDVRKGRTHDHVYAYELQRNIWRCRICPSVKADEEIGLPELMRRMEDLGITPAWWQRDWLRTAWRRSLQRV